MEPKNIESKNTLIKKQFTTVTPLSKYLAMVLFIFLPFVGFWLGTQYTSEPTESSLVEVSTASSTETEVVSPDSGDTTDVMAEPSQVNTPTQTTKVTPATPAGPTVVTAYIIEADLQWVILDNIAIYEDDAAVQRMILDGLCPASEPKKCRLENGVYYRNTDPTQKVYVLSPNVEIYTWTGTSYPLSQLVSRTSARIPYTVTMDSTGAVIKIKEIYRP